MKGLTDQENLNGGFATAGMEGFRRDVEVAELEARLVADGGIQEALIVWQEEQVLLNGSNRAAICGRVGLPFTTRAVSLPDREAAKAWILRHQSGRRNLTAEWPAYVCGKRFQVEKGRVGRTDANQDYVSVGTSYLDGIRE